ncbi:UNVERIFIED_CONTAM: hypothetical protein GTU68_005301 [Idotea baltica]|nr:hypothetical protein [Idotea baltica]
MPLPTSTKSKRASTKMLPQSCS